MIDTLVLRIHKLENYAETIKLLQRITKDGATKFFELNEEESKNSYISPSVKVIYHDSDNSLLISHRNSVFISSSHYSLSYLVDYKKDYVEFNFSVPKYLYGTNVLQFIKYFDQSVEQQFSSLRNFIKEFLQNKFFLNKVELSHVEINRLDICYNQFFPSIFDAKAYLKSQAQMAKRKNWKGEAHVSTYGDNTVMIKRKDYSFKIYHKGDEFRKNDYYQLLKNSTKYDVNELQNISDRILRYEMTIRNAFMNELFRDMYFENSPRIVKGIYRTLYKVLRIDGIYTKKLKQKKFMVKSLFDDWKDMKEKYGKEYWKVYVGRNNVTFDFVMYNRCFEAFKKWFKFFQIENTISPYMMEKKLAVINEGIEVKNMIRGVKLPKKNMTRLLFYAQLSTKQDLNELYKSGHISKSTYFRVKATLKKAGLSDFNPDQNHIKPKGIDINNFNFQEYLGLFGRYHTT